ncbi:ROK family transcriptional regulator [Anaerotignum faecicola]|nr:ROK family transcriptional regulator [Anaerotignum faecicola]
MIKGSKGLIRDLNTAAVIETIIKYAPISRIDIAKETGLTKSTVSTIAQNLIDNGIVEETETAGKNIGRKSIPLMLKSECGYAAAIEICRGTVRLMAFNMCGQKIYATKKLPYIDGALFETIKHAVDRCLLSLGQSDYGITGICLSVDGIVKNNRIIYPPSYETPMRGLADSLTEEYGLQVYIYNKANLAVLGENLYSIRTDNAALINVSNNINMGLISNGRLFTGIGGAACSIGHMVIEAGGKPCPCGNRGCFNQYASVCAILDIVGERKNHAVNFESFCHLFNSNDKDAHLAAAYFIKYMSIGLKNVINLYNPEIIVINCPLTTYFDEIFLRLKNSLDANKGILYRAMLKDDAQFYGGAAVCITNFLKIENFTPALCYFNRLKIL